MHIHILGICGTLMSGIALLARERGYRVSGSDSGVYPPMSTQLRHAGIEVMSGYDASQLDPRPDLIVVGNALSRGNPVVEHMLDQALPYTSGPAFLAEHVLAKRWVLGVAGTHGKTSTASMLAWILHQTGTKPGFLVGGVPTNFGVSARLGEDRFFVIEADEYDTAFFDKSAKFLHYRPRTLVLNNLEYDHADIFPDIEAIKRQFHYLVRTVPGRGRIILPAGDSELDDVLERGCWTPVEYIGIDEAPRDLVDWYAARVSGEGSQFEVFSPHGREGEVSWPLFGTHNMLNALAAVAAARHAGISPSDAIEALRTFKGVRRRMEVRARVGNVTIYDDFAHHPTAIAASLHGLRRRVGEARIIAVLEPRSNSMRMGVHKEALAASLREANLVILYRPDDLEWDLHAVSGTLPSKAGVYDSVEDIVRRLATFVAPGDHVLIMSNGAFGGIHAKLVEALTERFGESREPSIM